MGVHTEYRHSFFRWWDILLVVLAVLVAVVGVDILTSLHWTPRTVVRPDGESFHYPWRAVWVVAGAGAVLVAVGFIVGMERQIHNWTVVATGIGLLTLGTSYVAMERVTVTEDGFATRRWWGLESHAWQFDDLEAVTVVAYRGRKGSRWVAVRCQPKGEADPTFAGETSTPRLMEESQFALRRRAAPKGVAVNAVFASR